MEDLSWKTAINSWKTAIKRKSLSAPMRYLKETGRLFERILDFGCGKGMDADTVGADKYDPHFFPEFRGGPYEVVTCVYVLNVIENPLERSDVERQVMGKLAPGGDAYIAVRNDKSSLKGTTSKGTWQGFVEPSDEWQLIKTTSGFRLYHYRRPLILDPCPFCRGDSELHSGYIGPMALGVKCLGCGCRGPRFDYYDICDHEGCILPEYEHLSDVDAIGEWLLHRAQLAWNRRS